MSPDAVKWFAFLPVAAGLYWLREGDRVMSWGWERAIPVPFFLLFLWWLLTPRNRRGDPGAHEGVDQGIAFRLGKALNRVRRGKRSAA